MLEYSTLAALFAALFAFHLAAAWLVRHRAAPTTQERPEHLDDGRLRCPNCEAVNEPDYQFCRECVTKLREQAPTTPLQPTGGGSLFR